MPTRFSGQFNPVFLEELSADPSTSVAQGAVYTKHAGGHTELFYRQESNGAVYQLTASAMGPVLGSGAANQITFFTAANMVSGSNNLTWNNGTSTFDSTGTFNFNIAPNAAAPFSIKETGVGTPNYLGIVTTTAAQALNFGNATDNPTFNFLGSGVSNFNGNINLNNKHIIFGTGAAGAALTSTNFEMGVDNTGALQLNMVNGAQFLLNFFGTNVAQFQQVGALNLTPSARNGGGNGFIFTGTGAAHTNWIPPSPGGSYRLFDVLLLLNRTVQFDSTVGSLSGAAAIQIKAPTYSYNGGANTITAISTQQIFSAPSIGANITATFSAGLLIGDITGFNSNASSNAGALMIYPGIQNGAGSSFGSNFCIYMTGAGSNILLGNQTASIQEVGGLKVTQVTYVNNALTTTVTGVPAGVNVEAPVAGAGVTFNNTPCAFYARSGISRFDAGILVNAGGFNAPTIAFNGDTTTGFYRQGAGIIGMSSAAVTSFQALVTTSYSQLRFPTKFALEKTDGTRYIDFDPSGNFSFTNNTTGVQFNQSIGFFGHAVQAQQALVSLINNVVSSGTANQLDDFTSLAVYALDAQAIHNDIYNLGVKVNQIVTLLKNYGLSS